VQCGGSRSHQRQATAAIYPTETAIPAIRKAFAATAVATMVLAGSAACGIAANPNAAQRLGQAVDNLGKQRSLSVELDLDADPATLKSLDTSAAPGEEMPDQVAEFLAGTRISFSVQSRKPLEESAGQDLTGMAMKIGNQYGDLLEYRLVGEYVYLRADAQAIEKMTGGSVPSAGELPENADALRHVLNGEWVKVATSDLTQDAVPGQESEAPSAPTTPGEARHKQVMKGLRDVIASEVEFNDAGIRGGTDHVTATAPFRTLLTELMDEIRPLAGDIPPGASLPTDKDLKSAPNQKVTADFSIKAGVI
jgi:hypothetical protein